MDGYTAFLVVASCSFAFVLAGRGSTATGGVAKEEIKQAAASNCPKVDTATRQIIDEKGRARIFHGVNVVYKSFPYYPSNGSFDSEYSLNDEDIAMLVEYGFTVVRLYVAWPGVEPSRGNYNASYLDTLYKIVEKLGKAGIYTILDCHQDLWSPKFCGEGAPDYAALYMDRSIKPMPFPQLIPSLTPFKLDNVTGYPSRSDCNKHPFFSYYFSDAVGKAWQSLYDNEQQIQDHFAAFWAQVAQRFKDSPYVLGYELLNEPWVGDLYRHPDQLEPSVADPKNLEPMYKKLHSAIRKVDDEHIILFEPTIIITSIPLKGFANTGLSSGPGGPEYNDRQILAYHMYCVLIDSDGQPRDTRVCNFDDETLMEIRMADAKRLGVAGFMTEWGAYDNNTEPGTKPYLDGIELTNLADENLQSWSYWQLKGFGDFTTQSSTAEGVYYANSTLQSSKLKMLSRTYAQAVSGRYVSQSFDPESGDFSLVYSASVSLASYPTVIYLNEKFYYPNGYTVSVSPEAAAKYTTAHNRVEVTLVPSAVQDGQPITCFRKSLWTSSRKCSVHDSTVLWLL